MDLRGVFPPGSPDLITLYCNPEAVSLTPSFSLFAARKAFPSYKNKSQTVTHGSTHQRVVGGSDGGGGVENSIFLGGTGTVGKYFGKRSGNKSGNGRGGQISICCGFHNNLLALLLPLVTQESRVTPTAAGRHLRIQQ